MHSLGTLQAINAKVTREEARRYLGEVWGFEVVRERDIDAFLTSTRPGDVGARERIIHGRIRRVTRGTTGRLTRATPSRL